MKQGLCKTLGIPVLYFALLVSGQAAWADDPYVGEIRLFAYDFCPKNWVDADGRRLPIENYMELYSLYGNTYGGDGLHDFAVPDLRGRVPVGHGDAPGRSLYRQGQKGGEERTLLSVEQLPKHSHEVRSSPKSGEHYVSIALGGEESDKVRELIVHPSGGYQAHQNLPPYIAVRYCVAYKGYYPPRN